MIISNGKATLRSMKVMFIEMIVEFIDPMQIELLSALARERLRMRPPLPSQVRILSAYDTDRF